MINLIVVAAYLVGMVLLGLYMSKYAKEDDDFFLAGRCLNKWIIAGTIMATNVAAIYLADKDVAGVENSWIHKVFGSGLTWLLLYVVVTIIILILYFM